METYVAVLQITKQRKGLSRVPVCIPFVTLSLCTELIGHCSLTVADLVTFPSTAMHRLTATPRLEQ